MTAAQTMVASHTPDDRSGFAMGALSSAVFSGGMAGIALGGIFADRYGYRSAFFLASGLLVLASLLVMFGTNEEFTPVTRTGGTARQRLLRSRATLAPLLHLLIPMCLVSLLRRFDLAYLSLLVQDINGGRLAGSATFMGRLGAVTCAAGFLAGFASGHIGDRVAPMRVARLGALCGGLLMIPNMFAYSMPALYVIRFGMAFCLGSIEPMFSSLLVRRSPSGEKGFIFGWAATMRAAGWAVAPLISGVIAMVFNVRAIFLVGGLLLVIFSFYLPRIVGAQER